MSIGVQGTGSTLSTSPWSKAPGDFVRSLCIVCVKNGKVVRYQIEPATDPVHDLTAWNAHFDDSANYELIQDDELFYGVIVNMGTLGVVVSYCLELVDACFVREDRSMMTWDHFVNDEKSKIEQQVAEGTVARWHIWLSPYPIKENMNIVVMTYSIVTTDGGEVPPPVLTSKVRQCFVGLKMGWYGAMAITLTSRFDKGALVPMILNDVLKRAVKTSGVVMDPFAAMATSGAGVLAPGLAAGIAFDYKNMVPGVEEWQSFTCKWKEEKEGAIPGIMSVRYVVH